MEEVVLYQPVIPQNAGNIARTCAVTGSRLTLVRPLGFSTSSRHLKRAGLDYWPEVDVHIVDTLEERLNGFPFYFFSTKAKKLYSEISYTENDILIFGSEDKGLPQIFWDKWPENFYTIPMLPKCRSLNLSNAVAIVLYEAWRQQQFKVISKSRGDHLS